MTRSRRRHGTPRTTHDRTPRAGSAVRPAIAQAPVAAGTPRVARRPGGRAQATGGRSAPSWFLGLGALLLVGAAVAAVVVASAPDDRPTPSAVATIAPATVDGAALPRFVDPAADPAVGRRIPEAAGTAFDRTSVRIAADGRPKLLLFLAHWCPHCQREVPVVQAWLREGRLPAGVDLISVATSIDPVRPNYPPDAWLAREGWTPPVLVDPDEAVADRFGLGAFPYWVAVAPDGTVAARRTGELTPAQIEGLIAAVAP